MWGCACAGRHAIDIDDLVAAVRGCVASAALSPEAATVGASRQSDLFVEALAAASHRLARGWYAHGGLLLRRYRDLNQFDLTGLRAGLSYETDSGPGCVKTYRVV